MKTIVYSQVSHATRFPQRVRTELVVTLCSNLKVGGIGLAHSKTLARIWAGRFSREVLECGSPMPLFAKRHKLPNTLSPTFLSSALDSAPSEE